MNPKIKQRFVVMIALALTAIFCLVLPQAAAETAVTAFAVNPLTVLPGEELTLILTVENSADEKAENILVSLDLTNLPFAPVSTSSANLIDEIDDHDSERVYFFVKVLPNALPSTYKIPVVVSQNNVSKTALISIEVKAKAALELILDETQAKTIGASGSVVLKFVNNGLIQIKFLKVTLQESPYYEIISPASFYIGEVDAGDFETEEFTILPRGTDPILAVAVEYRDANNNVYNEQKLLELKVYTLEEAKLLGILPEKSSTTLIILVIAAILAVIFLWKRKRARKHAA